MTYKFIAGPCAIESVAGFCDYAFKLIELFSAFPKFELIYKGSFDKANRTLPGSLRGVGLEDAEIAWDFLRTHAPALRITTDIHETWQARPASLHVDVLQIPAFLGRQTSLLEAAAATGRIVNLKKPQWMGVEFFDAAALKTKDAPETWFTHRGTIGMGKDLVVDVLDLAEMYGRYEDQAFLDLTHTNTGKPWHSSALARAAAGIGIANFFAETHPEPEKAICDGNHQLRPTALKTILEQLTEILPEPSLEAQTRP